MYAYRIYENALGLESNSSGLVVTRKRGQKRLSNPVGALQKLPLWRASRVTRRPLFQVVDAYAHSFSHQPLTFEYQTSVLAHSLTV